MQIAIAILIVFILWSVWGFFGSRVEQARYTVIKKKSGYEIRKYPAHIVAQTTIKGSYPESMNEGFRIVAGYIFGNNLKKESIAMTAPVTAQNTQQPSSQKIAMTAPMIASDKGDSQIISFGMPQSQTLKTLPKPLDSRIKIVLTPEQTIAALKFSWFRNDHRIQKMQKKLLKTLTDDKIKVTGSPSYAGYNAPWTPPWMTRHEVMVAIEKPKK